MGAHGLVFRSGALTRIVRAMSAVHRSVVQALGDAVALAAVDRDGYLPANLWAEAFDRVRLARHPSLPLWEGSRRVGYEFAITFLRANENRLVLESLRLLTLHRAMFSVGVPMAERLRRLLQLDFIDSNDGGGLLQVRGIFVLHPAAWCGFWEGFITEVPGRFSVTLYGLGPDHLELLFTPY